LNQLVEYATVHEAVKHSIGGIQSGAGVVVNRQRASGLSAVAACVRVLSHHTSMLPLILYRKEGEKKLHDTANSLYLLLKIKPNEWQNSVGWRNMMLRHLLLRGNAFNYIVRGMGGRITELIPLDPDRMIVKQDDDLKKTFEYTRSKGGRVIYQQREILHFMGDSDDGLIGLNPIQLYRETIGDGIGIRQHGSSYYRNGAQAGSILELPGSSDQESKAALRADFEAMHRGSENAHRVAILDKGITYKPMTVSMHDAQYIESKKLSRTEIAAIFGVPPHMIAALENATFSNIEHQQLQYVIDSLMWWLVMIEKTIECDLLGADPSYEVKFNVSALLRGDVKSRAESLQIQRRNGVINANEWRKLEDMNPREDEGGEEYIVEQNMRINDGRGKDE
jgi:HK97 family phage portal protein